MAYTKLANSILTSTVWMEDDRTRIVWFAMMAMADRNGEVQASIPGLANIARVPAEDCRKAIQTFLSPDPDSRSKDDEGRRLEEIDGGWYLINHPKYRRLASDEDRREKAAIRQARWRDNNASNAPVTPPLRQKSQAEAEADSNTETNTHTHTRRFAPPCQESLKLEAAKIGLPETEALAFFNYYESNGWRVGKNPMKKWQAAMINWRKNWEEKGRPNRNNNGTNQSNRNEGIVGYEPGKAERVLAARSERDRAAKQSAQLTLATQVVGNGSNVTSGSGAS